MSELTLFLREAVARPIQMGALFPSSKQLAKQLVGYIPPNPKGIIVELGAGTGAITDLLLQQSYAKHVVAIESSTKLARHLQRRFPYLIVHQGDAQEARKLLHTHNQPVHAIMSGLPLRSLPKLMVHRIIKEIEALLPSGGLFIQYTYSLWGKLPVLSSKLNLIICNRAWCNLPPARIMVFQKK